MRKLLIMFASVVLFSFTRAGVQVDVQAGGPPPPYYYDDPYYNGYWYGPGWYWGVYINSEDDYWRHYNHHHHDHHDHHDHGHHDHHGGGGHHH